MPERILCVDDEANILAGMQRSLRKQYTVETALGGEEGLAAIRKNGPFAIVVSDMRMPGMDGVQFLSRVKSLAPDSVRMMLTGNADRQTAVDAVNKGSIFRFLTKPCTSEDLDKALNDGVTQHRLIRAERELLEQTLNGSVKVLTEILSIVEPIAFGRAQILRNRVYEFSASYAMSNSWELELAAMLSQIGFVTIPYILIEKSRSGQVLTSAERDMLVRIPEIGSRLLANIPRLDVVSKAVLYQNKHYDGSGFPNDAIKGAEIPYASRLLKVINDLLELEESGATRSDSLIELKNRVGIYDQLVLEAVSRVFGEESPHGADRMDCAEKKLHELGIGMLLVSNIETTNGQLLIAAGYRITETLLERIRNYSRLVGIREPVVVRVER